MIRYEPGEDWAPFLLCCDHQGCQETFAANSDHYIRWNAGADNGWSCGVSRTGAADTVDLCSQHCPR